MMNNPIEILCPADIDGIETRDLVIPSYIVKDGIRCCVTGIGRGAFSNCRNIVTVRLPETLVAVKEKAFLGCRNIESVILADSTEVIGDSAFSGCSALRNIEFGESLKSIGRYAFWGCGEIGAISFPAAMESIGRCSFSGCDKLKDIYCGAVPPLCDEWCFGFSDDVFKRAVLHVPNGSSGDYGLSPVWHKFSNIVEAGDVSGVDELNVSSDGSLEPVRIFDSSGKCVYRGNDALVDFLSPGNYVMVIGDKMMKIVIDG